MSYKTNPISNRLGISTGWEDINFVSAPKVYSEVFQKKVRLYFFLKEYFQKKNIKLLGFKLKKTLTLDQLHISIFSYKKKTSKKIKKLFKKRVKRIGGSVSKWKSRWLFKRQRTDFLIKKNYDRFICLLILRFKLKRLLQKLGFPLLNINITEPLKALSWQQIKKLQYSRFLRRNAKEKFFDSTIKLLHLLEKFQDVQLFANHLAQELEKLKNHWVLIRTVKTILRFWNFHHESLNKKKRFKKHWKFNKKKQPFYPFWWAIRRLWFRKKFSILRKKKQKKKLSEQALFLQKKIIFQKKLKKKRKFISKQHEFRKSIIGLRIGIFGKINASKRTRQAFILNGVVPVQTFSKRILFATSQARARTGAFGIKVWIYI